MKEIQRKLWICANCKCHKCDISYYCVPENCEFALKHILDTQKYGLVLERNRRTGKTTKILKMALDLSDGGYDVIIAVQNHMMQQEFQHHLMGTGVKLIVASSREIFRNQLQGIKKSVILSDEVCKWVSKEAFRMGHNFIISEDSFL